MRRPENTSVTQNLRAIRCGIGFGLPESVTPGSMKGLPRGPFVLLRSDYRRISSGLQLELSAPLHKARAGPVVALPYRPAANSAGVPEPAVESSR